jgi:hypothetical protein
MSRKIHRGDYFFFARADGGAIDERKLWRLVGGAVFVLLVFCWLRKARTGGNAAVERIKHEGGDVLAYSTIGFLFVDPFKHATSDAAGHRIRGAVRRADRDVVRPHVFAAAARRVAGGG